MQVAVTHLPSTSAWSHCPTFSFFNEFDRSAIRRIEAKRRVETQPTKSRLPIDLYITNDSFLILRRMKWSNNFIFHNLQIPPGPPLLKWGISFTWDSIVTPLCLAEVLAPSGCKGGLGGILNVMNYVKLNNTPQQATGKDMKDCKPIYLTSKSNFLQFELIYFKL